MAVERILCYPKKNPGKGLIFTKADGSKIKGYFDTDWAGSVDIHKSTTGYYIFLRENLII